MLFRKREGCVQRQLELANKKDTYRIGQLFNLAIEVFENLDND